MQPILLRFSLLPEHTSVAWMYAAAALLCLGLAGWGSRQGRSHLVIGLLVAIGVLAASLGYVRRARTLPNTEWVLTSSGGSLVLAAVVGAMLVLGLSERAGVKRERALSALFISGLSGVLVARWMYLIVNPSAATHIASWFSVKGGGLLGYPGMLVGLGVGSAWLRRRASSADARAWLDAAAPALALGVAITRGGCYLFGCDYGRMLPRGSSGWLANLGSFPHWPEHTFDGRGAPAWSDHVHSGLIEATAPQSLPVHPVQLYELGLSLCLFGGLVWLRPRCRAPGQLFALFVLGYAVIRFSLETIRGDWERGVLGPSLEGRLLLGLGWVCFGLLISSGPASAMVSARHRAALRVGVLLPGVLLLGYRALMPAWDALPLTLAQALALLSAGVAALGVSWSVAGRPLRAAGQS